MSAPDNAEPAAPEEVAPPGEGTPGEAAPGEAAAGEAEAAAAEEGDPEAAAEEAEPAEPEEPEPGGLRKYEPDPSKDVAANEAFVLMAGYGQIDEMQGAMDSNPDISYEYENEDGWTPLMWAAGINIVPAVRWLDEQGAAIDRKNRHGNTALRYAACNGKLEAVGCLLELGADCNMLQQNMYTPFIAACGKDRSLECVRTMMDFTGPLGGAKLHLETPTGKTALHEASLCGASKVLKVLLQNGAKVQTENLVGRTALMEAVMYGRCEVIEILHEFKAKMEHQSTKDGLTALDLALREKQRKAAGVIQQLAGGEASLSKRKPIMSTVDREAQFDIGKIINQRDGVNNFFSMMKPGGLLEVIDGKPLEGGKLALIERDYKEKGLLVDLSKPAAAKGDDDKNWADVKHNQGRLEHKAKKK